MQTLKTSPNKFRDLPKEKVNPPIFRLMGIYGYSYTEAFELVEYYYDLRNSRGILEKVSNFFSS